MVVVLAELIRTCRSSGGRQQRRRREQSRQTTHSNDQDTEHPRCDAVSNQADGKV